MTDVTSKDKLITKSTPMPLTNIGKYKCQKNLYGKIPLSIDQTQGAIYTLNPLSFKYVFNVASVSDPGFSMVVMRPRNSNSKVKIKGPSIKTMTVNVNPLEFYIRNKTTKDILFDGKLYSDREFRGFDKLEIKFIRYYWNE